MIGATYSYGRLYKIENAYIGLDMASPLQDLIDKSEFDCR